MGHRGIVVARPVSGRFLGSVGALGTQGRWFGGRICAEAMSCQVGRFGGILMDNVHLVVLVLGLQGQRPSELAAALRLASSIDLFPPLHAARWPRVRLVLRGFCICNIVTMMIVHLVHA